MACLRVQQRTKQIILVKSQRLSNYFYPFDDLLVREYFHYLEVMTMKFGVHIYLWYFSGFVIAMTHLDIYRSQGLLWRFLLHKWTNPFVLRTQWPFPNFNTRPTIHGSTWHWLFYFRLILFNSSFPEHDRGKEKKVK